jgi:hypothetical protein
MPSSHSTLRNSHARDVQAARQWYEKELARTAATRRATASTSLSAAGHLNRRDATPQQKAEAWFHRTYGNNSSNSAPSRARSVARNASRGSSPSPVGITTPRRIFDDTKSSSRAFRRATNEEYHEEDDQADTGDSCSGGWVLFVWVMVFLSLVQSLAADDYVNSTHRPTNGANVYHAASATRAAAPQSVDLGWSAAAPHQSQTGIKMHGPEDILNGSDGGAMTLDPTATSNDNDFHGTTTTTTHACAAIGNVTQWVEEMVYFVKKTLVAWSIDRTCSATIVWHSVNVDETTGTRHLFSVADVARDVLLDDDALWTMIRNAPEYSQVFVWRSVLDSNKEPNEQLLIGLHPSQPCKVPWPCRVQNGFQHFALFAFRLLWDLCQIVTVSVVVTIQTFPMVSAATASGLAWYRYHKVRRNRKYYVLYQ